MQAQTHFTYRTGFQRWRAGEAQGFQDWSTQGICLNARGQLVLDPEGLRQEVSLEEPEVALRTPSRLRDRGRPFYPLGPYWVGEATSPAVPTSFPMVGAIASWNATTPPAPGWNCGFGPSFQTAGQSGITAGYGLRIP
jgi:hypothetical protein